MTNEEGQFMGKRNSINQQVTAPAQNGQRKGKSATINVDELAGSALGTGNMQPATTTGVFSS